MNQAFYIKMDTPGHWYIDEKYLRCMYCKDDNNEDMCHLGTDDDFELSVTGPCAFGVFVKLQELIYEKETVSHDELLTLGFRQYG